ncbi:hypothetical protein LGT39_12880 [Demequina sp. TTPB684]|uniref:hypothetical protein n=1 Tax=unclassified Demequina TaxID=2620311 RepID=UPI001CF273C7|nr:MULTISPECIES: hypothetical protein [unclassified Demequina]MCB2413738.1 hypothetical protein [Demequina sp. TTPB684]UPU89591.1 hypothetical protein LGT36_006590 [Demequina sp. TMPB413]
MARDGLADNFWDLRDDASDHPDRWVGVVAESVFQRLAELVEAAQEHGEVHWRRDVVQPMIAWRSNVDER